MVTSYTMWEEDYLYLENDFLDFIKYVPLDEEHDDVWSLKLANLLLLIGSSVDSFFKYIMPEGIKYTTKKYIENNGCNICGNYGYLTNLSRSFNSHRSDRTTMINFRFIFEECDELSKRTVYVLRNKKAINPFEKWSKDKAPNWWNVYTKLKHDKFKNRKKAKLHIVLEALAALFLLNVNSFENRTYLAVNGVIKSEYFLNWHAQSITQLIEELKRKPINNPMPMIARTNLFAYIYDDSHYWNRGIDNPWKIIDPGNIYGED